MGTLLGVQPTVLDRAPLDIPLQLVPNPPMKHRHGCRTRLTAQHPGTRFEKEIAGDNTDDQYEGLMDNMDFFQIQFSSQIGF